MQFKEFRISNHFLQLFEDLLNLTSRIKIP
jgi:hypothetical protein